MIIIGFPGIGKSSVANPEHTSKRFTGYIDLESNNFTKIDGWENVYCKVALDLSQQGYDVFVSSHKQVRDYLAMFQDVDDIIEVFPEDYMHDIWIDRLTKRYNSTKKEKHKKALEYMSENYYSAVADMKNDNIERKIILDAESYIDDLDREIGSYCMWEGL